MTNVNSAKRCRLALFAAVLLLFSLTGCQFLPQTSKAEATAPTSGSSIEQGNSGGEQAAKGLKGLFRPSSGYEDKPNLEASIASTMRGIAFARDPDVYYLPPGSAKPVKIARGSSPALDPTGKQIAFLSLPPSGADPLWVSVSGIDGKGSRVVYRSKSRLNDLEWSSQGDLLVASFTKDGEVLQLLFKAGSGFSDNPVEVARTGHNDANGVWAPRWAPDGGSVIFHDLAHLFQVSLSGAVIEKTPIEAITGKVNSIDSGCSFSLSPTNHNLYAYTSAVPGTDRFNEVMGGEPNSALFVYDTSAKRRKRLSPPDIVCMDPVWTPDGKSIILGGYREPHYTQAYPFRIYKISADGTGLTELARGESPSP